MTIQVSGVVCVGGNGLWHSCRGHDGGWAVVAGIVSDVAVVIPALVQNADDFVGVP